MTTDELVDELAKYIPPGLASDLVHEFAVLRTDCKTNTLGRSSAGKFVETVVQVMQYLETGTYAAKPSVDHYLRTVEMSNSLNDDLRICCSRVARACYTLRNKRNIAHKGAVDPNAYDLAYTFACSQWILAELVRQTLTAQMDTAGRMIDYIRVPVCPVVEDFGSRKLIHGQFSADEELLVLLHSCYPDAVLRKVIRESLDRRAESTVRKSLQKLWKQKLIHTDGSMCVLTQQGYNRAQQLLQTA